MNDDERRHFDNLILLCPNHHTHVDDCEPDRFTVAVLTEMKRRAEERAEPYERWATDELLDRAAHALEVTMDRLRGLQGLQQIPMQQVPITNAEPGTATAHVEVHGSTLGTTSGVDSTDPVVLGEAVDPRVMQIQQIVGYNSVYSLDATVDYVRLELSETPSREQIYLLDGLAKEYEFTMDVLHDSVMDHMTPTGRPNRSNRLESFGETTQA